MLNSCDFQGRFAADPELRTTQTGKQVASFRMGQDGGVRQQVFPQGERRCSSFPLPDAAV